MARFIQKSKSEIGQSPFDIKFRGRRKTDHTRLRVMDFDLENLQESELTEFREVQKYLDTQTVTWLNVDGLHDEDLLAQIGEVFELDRTIMSDVINTEQRPRVQEYEECLYISIKMLRLHEESNEVSAENLSMIVAENLLITFQERPGDVFEPVRERIRKQKKKIRGSGTDYLAFTLLDIVIDHYIYLLSELGDRIEQAEERLLAAPDQRAMEQINDLKREINFLRKHIHPAREMVSTLSKLDSDLIDSEQNGVHYRELQSNIQQATETSDSYREILSDLLNIYHMTISAKLNDVMKFLTIFSVIFIPLTFIAGIYGTNFDYLPELHYEYSYYIMWAVMLIITLVMVGYFRKKKWF